MNSINSIANTSKIIEDFIKKITLKIDSSINSSSTDKIKI
jgi:hypothetical protein